MELWKLLNDDLKQLRKKKTKLRLYLSVSFYAKVLAKPLLAVCIGLASPTLCSHVAHSLFSNNLLLKFSLFCNIDFIVTYLNTKLKKNPQALFQSAASKILRIESSSLDNHIGLWLHAYVLVICMNWHKLHLNELKVNETW